ncbi:MAG TPA: hypothetical protein VGT08_05705 [Terracidiphilus sp.]|nr:hypothetical protein [Terracidiphilus sp.]
MVPFEARRGRTLDREALALAFATLYTKYADELHPHFVLPDDREMVTSIVSKFLRERQDKLGEMYFGPSPFEQSEVELAKRTVDRAIELFTQI